MRHAALSACVHLILAPYFHGHLYQRKHGGASMKRRPGINGMPGSVKRYTDREYIMSLDVKFLVNGYVAIAEQRNYGGNNG